MKPSSRFGPLLVLALGFLFFGAGEEQELKILAPPLLRGLLTELGHLAEKRNPGVKITLLFQNPSEQERHVRLGLPADAIITADNGTLNNLMDDDLILDESMKKLYINDVLIVTQADSEYIISSPKDLVTEPIQRFVVCGGNNHFCKETHDYVMDLGFPESAASKMETLPTPKEALDRVKSESAKWTFAFSSDLGRAKKLRPLWYVDPSDIEPLIFYGATVTKSSNRALVDKFFLALDSPIARQIFENAGLRPANVPLPHNPPPLPTRNTEEEENEAQTQPQTQEGHHHKGAQTQTQTQSQTQTQTQSQSQPHSPSQSQPQSQTQP